MVWKVMYLVIGLAVDFLPVTLVPTISYHQGDFLGMGPLWVKEK